MKLKIQSGAPVHGQDRACGKPVNVVVNPEPHVRSDLIVQHLLAESAPAFHGIKPVVAGGSVRLTGSVPSAAAKLHAEELVYLIPDVIDVHNDLVVGSVSGKKGEPKVIQNNEKVVVRLSHALASDARTKNAVIEVIEDRGIVTLQGAVADAKMRAAVEEIASRQSGVTVVVNELAIASRN
jgi:osmotically-inducible protein OsmY